MAITLSTTGASPVSELLTITVIFLYIETFARDATVIVVTPTELAVTTPFSLTPATCWLLLSYPIFWLDAFAGITYALIWAVFVLLF